MFRSLLMIAAGVTIALAALLAFVMRHGDDDDQYARSHQQMYDDDGQPFQR